MPDTVHHVMWYTVYDAKNGNLLASGTSDMCARRLGYKSANSFASSVYHCRSKKRKPHKYSFFQEVGIFFCRKTFFKLLIDTHFTLRKSASIRKNSVDNLLRKSKGRGFLFLCPTV